MKADRFTHRWSQAQGQKNPSKVETGHAAGSVSAVQPDSSLLQDGMLSPLSLPGTRVRRRQLNAVLPVSNFRIKPP